MSLTGFACCSKLHHILETAITQWSCPVRSNDASYSQRIKVGSLCLYCTVGNLWGKNFHEFWGFVAICESLLRKIWGCGVLWWHQQAICERFLHKNFPSIRESFLLQKFPAIWWFPLYVVLILSSPQAFCIYAFLGKSWIVHVEICSKHTIVSQKSAHPWKNTYCIGLKLREWAPTLEQTSCR